MAGRRRRVEKAARVLVPQATLRLREGDEGLSATVVLPEGAPPEPSHQEIERQLIEAGAARCTVVGSSHRAPGGHDNPLGLAPKRRTGGPPQKLRPKGAGRVVAVASGKGGVGKSTVAARLALALADRGERVGLLDLDVYGPSMPVMFGAEKPTLKDGAMVPPVFLGLKLMSIGFLVDPGKAVAWRGPMVMGAVRQLIEETDWGGIDTLIVDTPPGTGDTHLSMAQRLALDGAIVVTTPSPLALADAERGKALFDKTGIPVLGLVETMAALPGSVSPFGPPLGEEALSRIGLDRLTSLPLDERLARLPRDGGDLGLDLLGPVADAVAAIPLPLDQAAGPA